MRFRTLAPLWPVVVLFSAAVFAQTTGRIEGIVRDPSGAVVPDATLTISESQTGARRQMNSNQRGWYIASELATGSYDIEVSHPGFRTEARQGVYLAAGRELRIDFLLEAGQTRESVVVVGEAPLINVSASDWGGTIERAKLEALPLNGRDLFDLAAQQPGATVSSTVTKRITNGSGTRLSVNGARPNQNGYRMDGIYINDATAAAPTSSAGRLLGIEAVQELNLAGSPFDAEYGRAGGAVFTAVSKSGSNDFHGSAYEFLRNSALDAKNYFDLGESKIPPLRRNQFGAVVTGPIRRNSLFFMVNYEANIERSSLTLSSITPTAAARQGKLPDRTITVSPAAAPFVALYPLPNGRDYGDGTAAFVTDGPTVSNESYATGKIDYLHSERLRTAVRYTVDTATTDRPDPLKFFTYLSKSQYQFLHTETQFVQSPSTLHVFRAGFSRVWNSDDATQPGSATADASFVQGMGMGTLNFTSGPTSFGGNTISTVPRRFVVNDYQVNEVSSMVRGQHSIRFGGSFDRVQFNQRSDLFSRGSYSFSSLVDFLQASPRSGELMMPGTDTIRGWRQNIYSLFVQDEYRPSARLTVSIGLRYEPYSTPTEVNGKIAVVTDLLTSTATRVGGPLFVNPSANNFAPRLAIAWDPTGSGKMVIRAGGGFFYDLLGTRELVTSGVRTPPFYNDVTVTRPPFPNIVAAVSSAPSSATLDVLDYHIGQPRTEQWQLQLQRKVAANTVFQVGYVGARGLHLITNYGETNPPVPQILSTGELFFPANAPRRNPAFGRMRGHRSFFDSSYHGLQAGLQGRWSKGLRWQSKYVWSKTLDDGSSLILGDFANSDSVPNPYNVSVNKGPSDFDLRHAFASNFSYSLPGWNRSAAGVIFGGWELDGLVQVQTGPHFNPTVGFDRVRVFGSGSTDGGQRPVLLAAPGAQIILGDPQRYFDPTAFGLPPAGMYGNLGRNVLTGPGLANIDLALNKALFRTERQNVRLRVEMFNVANHPNFQMPSAVGLFASTGDRNGSAGQITQTVTTSRQIQLSARWSF